MSQPRAPARNRCPATGRRDGGDADPASRPLAPIEERDDRTAGDGVREDPSARRRDISRTASPVVERPLQKHEST
jgi:hypothetical protein